MGFKYTEGKVIIKGICKLTIGKIINYIKQNIKLRINHHRSKMPLLNVLK